MKIAILERWTNACLWSGEAETLREGVEAAVKSGADLYGANLYGANLSRANGITPERSTALLMLLDQPGPIRAYKLVTADLASPINTTRTLRYDIGSALSVGDANTDVNEPCAAGVNVATLDWCLREWREGWRVMIVEFTAQDIAAIPTATDGKFRLHRCTVVGEKDITTLVTKTDTAGVL